MSIASEITRLYNVRGDIFDAIDAKGVSVPASSVLDDAPELISQIQSGGGAYTIDYVQPQYAIITGPDCSRVSAYIEPSVSCDLDHGLDYFTVNGVAVQGYGFDMPAEDVEVGAVIKFVDRYNPLNLPAKTIRCRFAAGVTPTMGDSRVLVDAASNVWDITKNGTSWYQLFNYNNDIKEILGANATGVQNFEMFCHYAQNLEKTAFFDTRDATNVWNMYNKCYALEVIPDYELNSATNCESFAFACTSMVTPPNLYTPNATNMSYMFYQCSQMKTMPTLITSKVTNVTNMFSGCTQVEHGQYDFYIQLSTQTNPPGSHSGCFQNCGSASITGSAELSRIPSGWK